MMKRPSRMKRRKHRGCRDRLLSSCSQRTLSKKRMGWKQAVAAMRRLTPWAPKPDRYTRLFACYIAFRQLKL